MAAIEQVERLGGASFLGVPAFDFFVWALDTYARGDLLMSLHGQLPPILLNPGIGFLCMCAGLGLLYMSHKRHIESLRNSGHKIVDSSGAEYQKTGPPWRRPVIVVFLIVLLATPLLAIGYSLAYKGFPPQQISLSPPASAYLKTPPPPVRRGPPSISVAQNGKNNISQIGGINNKAVINPAVVQSIVLDARAMCDLKDGATPPGPTTGFWMSDIPDAALSGAGHEIILPAITPIINKPQTNNRIAVTESFALPPNSMQVGQPVESLSFVDTVSVQMLGIAFSNWCESVHGIDISIAVNGKTIWQKSGPLEGPLPLGAAPQWKTEVKDWAGRIKSLTD